MQSSLDIVLRAFDQTGPAFDSAKANVEGFNRDIGSAAASAGGASGGFGAIALSALTAGVEIAAVGAVVAGAAYLIYKNFDTISAVSVSAFGTVWDYLKSFGEWVAGELSPWIVQFITSMVSDLWDTVKSVGNVIKGITNAILAGEWGLAGKIALQALEVAFLTAKANILQVWDDMLVSIVDFLQTHMKSVLEVWNAAVGQVAGSMVNLFLDDDEMQKRSDKAYNAALELQKKAADLDKQGRSDEAERARKSAKDILAIAEKESPGAGKAAAARMVQTMTQDFQIKLDKGELAKGLADKANADAATRLKEIASSKAELQKLLEKAQNDAGPNAIGNALGKLKAFGADAGSMIWDKLFGPNVDKSPAQLAEAQNSRFLTGVSQSAQERMVSQQQEANGLMQQLIGLVTGAIPGYIKDGVKAGVEGAKSTGLVLM